MGSTMRVCRSIALFVLLAAGGCALDRRRLQEATGGASFDGRDEPVGGESEPRDLVAGGKGASSRDLVDGCADLDTDGAADCTVTLVQNAAFSKNVANWTAQAQTQLSWADENALEDAPSGSAKLESASARASAEQCVEVRGQKLIIAYASALVDDESGSGAAQLQVSFYENEGCEGEFVAYFVTPSTVANRWATIQAGAVSPSSTASLSVALVGARPDAAESIRVYFDNVMLKAKDLM